MISLKTVEVSLNLYLYCTVYVYCKVNWGLRCPKWKCLKLKEENTFWILTKILFYVTQNSKYKRFLHIFDTFQFIIRLILHYWSKRFISFLENNSYKKIKRSKITLGFIWHYLQVLNLAFLASGWEKSVNKFFFLFFLFGTLYWRWYRKI